jgi:phosphoribosylanthranilate isomerase
MSLWVKICANTSLADAQVAAEAGADAVGFVFAPSPRRVSAEQVAEITPLLPANLEKIGVFVDAEFDEIAQIVEQCGLTGVQFHVNGGADAPARLRERFGPGLRLLRVVHFGENAERQLHEAAMDPGIDAVLIDSRTATAVGGTGVPFDWEAARRTLFTGATARKLIAAGGLNPKNVAEAIRILRPAGVDVVTGVESSPGRKDAEKVRTFVANARSEASLRSPIR